MRLALARRLLAGTVAAAMVSGQALAACPTTADQETFEVLALKSEMMVLATNCHNQDAGYNAFINRYKSDLMNVEHRLDAYFKGHYGKRGQQEHDSYVTSLANAQSEVGQKQGSDFCPRNEAIFQEVMALVDSRQLPEYAAGKDLIPASLGSCSQEESAPATKASATKRVTRKH